MEADGYIDSLVELGVIEEIVDPVTGQISYRVTPSAEHLAPGLWDANLSELKKTLYRLWNHGVVTIMFSDKGPLMDSIALTDEAFDKSVTDSLEPADRAYLDALIKVFQEPLSD